MSTVDLGKSLLAIATEVSKLETTLAGYSNIKDMLDKIGTKSLYRCVMDDAEVTIVEYILADNEADADKIFGWTGWDGLSIERVIDADDFIKLLQKLRVQTVNEDFD